MENVSKPTPLASELAPASSGLDNSVMSPLTLGLVCCGGFGALLCTAIYLLAGATRPGYDAGRQPISALSLGPGGWLQQANFITFGVLLSLSAVGWYRALAPARSAIWFPLFQGIAGLCLVGAGLFSMDPFPGYPPGAAVGASTTHGTLHTIFAWAIILSLAWGCFTLGAFSMRLLRSRAWAVLSCLAGALILVFWALFVRTAPGPLNGLYERLSAGSHALWLCALTAWLVAQSWKTRSKTAR